MDIATVLKQGKEELKKNGIEQFHLEAELVLGYILSWEREKILAHPEHNISEKERSRYEQLISERSKDTPLAYLLGYKEFYGYNFEVNEHVLIPRPETELLVEEVLKYYNDSSSEETPLLVDVGTGSGCIPIVLLKEVVGHIRSLAIETEPEALKTAYKNALKHKVEYRIKFLYGNLLFPLFKQIQEIKGYSHIFITANLPYVNDTLYKKSPSIWKEPQKSLLGGGIDGLDLYRELFHQIGLLKQRVNIECTVFCEIDPEQVPPLQEFISNNFTFYHLLFEKDLYGDHRAAILRI